MVLNYNKKGKRAEKSRKNTTEVVIFKKMKTRQASDTTYLFQKLNTSSKRLNDIHLLRLRI